MTDDDTAERVADWAAGHAAGFAAGCDTSELGRLYQRALQERDAAKKAARALDRRLKTLQGRIAAEPTPSRHANDGAGPPVSLTTSLPPRCCAPGSSGALFGEKKRETAYPEP